MQKLFKKIAAQFRLNKFCLLCFNNTGGIKNLKITDNFGLVVNNLEIWLKTASHCARAY